MSKYKLNLSPVLKAPIAAPAKPKFPVSPIGWWNVTTEGDEEGRSTKQLGDYYGHIAEIAFHLADKCFYTLQFRESKKLWSEPCDEHGDAINFKYYAKSKNVWISFDIASDTWNLTPERRAVWVDKFLNAEGITVTGRSEYATYYAGAYLTLKDF